MTFGERLIKLRHQQGLSQDALAEALGVSRQSVSKWETDTSIPELDKLIKLSCLFGVSLDELVKGEAPPAAVSKYPARLQILWTRVTAWYREKAYLLGWLLTAWGLYGIVQSVLAVVIHYLPAGGVSGAPDLFGTMLYLHVTNLLKILLSLLVVCGGKRNGGPFQWYQLG